jgi:hypothetical protein
MTQTCHSDEGGISTRRFLFRRNDKQDGTTNEERVVIETKQRMFHVEHLKKTFAGVGSESRKLVIPTKEESHYEDSLFVIVTNETERPREEGGFVEIKQRMFHVEHYKESESSVGVKS